ncbi:MAG: hypothetical protein IPF88_08005 [Candidatus Microthrix sp.]|nr:hypothetical protein [Candidatus Microthrix sp.]MBK6438526.1 hypothetical protein [Candidatus Microthrix sp.]
MSAPVRSRELAEQQRFDSVDVLEVDGGDGLVAFEEVVSAFEVGLVAVGGEDFGIGEMLVVGDERETAVAGGVVCDEGFVGVEDEPVASRHDLAVVGVGAWSAPLLLFELGGGVFGDGVANPAGGARCLECGVGCGLDGDLGFIRVLGRAVVG